MKDGKNKNWVIKYISKVFSWFLLTILILVAGFLVYYVVAANIYARKGEEFKPKFSLYTIVSPSMVPNINVYDVIFDVRVDDLTKLKKGDVITFISSGYLNEGMTVTHRIVDVINDEDGLKFRTKGDNNLVPDSALVEPGNVIGKTLFKIPQLGRVQSLLATKGGWLFLVLLPALGVIIYDIIKIIKLTTVKKKVDQSILDNEVKIDPEQIRREKERKEMLKSKYLHEDNNKEKKLEEDIKKEIEEEVSSKAEKEPEELPKVENEEVIEKKEKTNNNSSRPKNQSKNKSNKNKKQTKKVVKVNVDLPKKK